MKKRFWVCTLLFALLLFALPLSASAGEAPPAFTIDGDEDLADFILILPSGTLITDPATNTITIINGFIDAPVLVTGGYELTINIVNRLIVNPSAVPFSPLFTVNGGASLTIKSGILDTSDILTLLVTDTNSRCIIDATAQIMGHATAMNNGTLTVYGSMNRPLYENSLASTVTLVNGGTLWMYAGSIETNTDALSALSVQTGGIANIQGGAVGSIENYGMLNVSGGTIARGLHNDDDATAVINGGNLTAVINLGSMTVNGGSFTGTYTRLSGAQAESIVLLNTGTGLIVNGGTFTGSLMPALYNAGSATLSGGTFQRISANTASAFQTMLNVSGSTLTLTYSASATPPLSIICPAGTGHETFGNDGTLLVDTNTRVKLDGVFTRPADIPTRTSATITIAPTTVPATPGSFQITPQAAGDYSLGANGLAISFTWTAPDDGGSPVTGYNLKYGTSASLLDREATLAADATGCTIDASRFLSDTAYYYELYAVNALGTSVKTATLSATTPAATVYPVTVAGVQVTNFIAHDILAGLVNGVKATYTPKTAASPAVLTLSPASNTGSVFFVNDGEAISAAEPLVIETTNPVMIFHRQNSAPLPNASVIDAHDYPLTFRGKLLYVLGENTSVTRNGIRAKSVTVEGTADLYLAGYFPRCILADNLTVRDQAYLVCHSFASDLEPDPAIALTGTLTVSGDAQVYAFGNSYGVEAARIVLRAQGSSTLSAQNTRTLGSPSEAMLTATGYVRALSVTPVSADAAYRVTAMASDTINASDTAAWDCTTPLGGVASPYLYVAAALEKAPSAPTPETPTYGHIPNPDAPVFTAGGKPAPADDPNPNTGIGGRASF